MDWEVIDTGVSSAEQNMQRDAHLLESALRFSRPVLHLYEWEGRCATYGYFLDPAWQLIARYGIVALDRDFKVGNQDKFHEIAAGVNFFLGDRGSYGNRAKITVDVTYLPNGSPAALGNDFRASPNKKDEIVGRAQLQLWL